MRTMNDTKINEQWRSRPIEQRYLSLTDMAYAMRWRMENSAGKVFNSRQLEAVVDPVRPHTGLMVQGPKGNPAAITNWGFSQLAQRAGAPSGYLRSLPAPLAADCVNYGLKVSRDVEDIGVLVQKNDNGLEIQSVTGPRYGRIWNAPIIDRLIENFGDGISGEWKVPGEFGVNVPVTLQNTTLYAGDRDMFVFLADEVNRITIPNRRDGKTGSLARGFYIQNSEVGAATAEIGMYLFDYACKNRILWGVEAFQKIVIRHTASAPERWIEEAMPALEVYAKQDPNETILPVEAAIKAAQKAKVDNLEAFLMKRKYNKADISRIQAAHIADEGRPMETLWDITTGITALARSSKFQDERVELEKDAGLILSMAL